MDPPGCVIDMNEWFIENFLLFLRLITRKSQKLTIICRALLCFRFAHKPVDQHPPPMPKISSMKPFISLKPTSSFARMKLRWVNFAIERNLRIEIFWNCSILDWILNEISNFRMESTACWFTSRSTLRSVWRSSRNAPTRARRSKRCTHWQSVALTFPEMLDSHWIPFIPSQHRQMKLVCRSNVEKKTISLHKNVFISLQNFFCQHFSIHWEKIFNESKFSFFPDLLRQYLTQIRQETGNRLIEKVFGTADGKPSKWWTCFAKKKFMEHSLSGFGQ